MDNVSALLSEVVCGHCKTSLSFFTEVDGIKRYKCGCLLKTRALLSCTHCKELFLNIPCLIRKTNYCSLKCYWTGTKKKKLKICKICGEKFQIKSYLIKQGYGFYCSKKCWFSLFEKQRKIIRCKECQKERSVYKSVYLKHPRFCSKKCSDESKKDHISRICRNCKEEFELNQSALNRGRGSFCTWNCFIKFRGESSLEKIVRVNLQKLNEPFKQEMRIGRYYADFYLPNRNLVIECDGEFWHMREIAKASDSRKDKFLKKQGYKVLRLSGKDIQDERFDNLNKYLV